MSDQPYPEGAASLVAPPGAAGVPVVDLTATTRGLYERADRLRVEAQELLAGATVTARQLRETAEQLEQVASVLSGGTGG